MRFFLIVSVLIGIPFVLFGIDCKQLKTNEEIIRFVEKAKESNPLMRNNFSVLIESSPCEKELCLKKNYQKRLQKKELIHIVRINEKKRLKFIKGENAPQCFVKQGNKEFKCDSCELHLNYNCRSYKSAESSSKLQGTNIDSSDFDLLTDENHRSICRELPSAPKYLKIITSRISGNSVYDEIVAFYEKSREIPVTVNFYNRKRLYKVYRFFLKHYFKISGAWYSTFIRVRTTLGKEKFYEYETVVRVLKDKSGRFHLFTEPEKDPLINKGSPDDLFRTN